MSIYYIKGEIMFRMLGDKIWDSPLQEKKH